MTDWCWCWFCKWHGLDEQKEDRSSKLDEIHEAIWIVFMSAHFWLKGVVHSAANDMRNVLHRRDLGDHISIYACSLASYDESSQITLCPKSIFSCMS